MAAGPWYICRRPLIIRGWPETPQRPLNRRWPGAESFRALHGTLVRGPRRLDGDTGERFMAICVALGQTTGTYMLKAEPPSPGHLGTSSS